MKLTVNLEKPPAYVRSGSTSVKLSCPPTAQNYHRSMQYSRIENKMWIN